MENQVNKSKANLEEKSKSKSELRVKLDDVEHECAKIEDELSKRAKQASKMWKEKETNETERSNLRSNLDSLNKELMTYE